ncbi:hypothetical protein TNCV_3641671 [Trichonephila clavipes]|nr:hypothetical protein TNCV_3641671 [Trichonephila clavipes]
MLRGCIGGLVLCRTVTWGDQQCLESLGVSYRIHFSSLFSTRLNAHPMRYVGEKETINMLPNVVAYGLPTACEEPTCSLSLYI